MRLAASRSSERIRDREARIQRGHAQLLGQCQADLAIGRRTRDVDVRPCGPGALSDKEAYRTWSDDQDHIARDGGCPEYRVKRDDGRLDNGRVADGHSGGQLMQEMRWNAHHFSHAARPMDAEDLTLYAELRPSFPAVGTGATGDDRLRHDRHTGPDADHTRTCLENDSGELVSKHHGRLHEAVEGGVPIRDVQIAPAERGTRHLHQRFTWAGGGLLHLTHLERTGARSDLHYGFQWLPSPSMRSKPAASAATRTRAAATGFNGASGGRTAAVRITP